MSSQPPTLVKPLMPLTRAVFGISVLLAGIAGAQLYVLATHTDRYFAWTIGNPLSAAFIGTGFWAGTLLLLFAIREEAWANVRVAVAAVLTFVPLMVLATLMHLNAFHFHSHLLGARIAAWAWLTVYVVVPFILAATLLLQLRTPGGDPSNGMPVPIWVRAFLGLNGVISLAVGLCLTLIPHRVFAHWPWGLTEFTAQATGAGFLTIGITSLWFVRENGWARGRDGTVPFLLIGVLQLLALLRFHGSVEWGRVGAWLYLLYIVGILIGGSYSTLMVWRIGPENAPPITAVPRET